MNTWSCTPAGVRTVMILELRTKARSTRWKLILLIAFVLLSALAWALISTYQVYSWDGAPTPPGTGMGPTVMGVGALGALVIGLILAPPMAGASVNGDRAAGVLAPLQMTHLSASELAIGKFVAAWLSALMAIVVGLPWMITGQVMGGLPWATLPVAVLLITVILGVTTAIGLALSALTARPLASLTLTYLVIAALFGGTAIVFAWGVQFTQSTEQTTVYGIPDDVVNQYYADLMWSDEKQAMVDHNGDVVPELSPDQCRDYTYTYQQAHPQRLWWLLAPNPMVMLVSLTPEPTDMRWENNGGALDGLRHAVAYSLSEDDIQHNQCWYGDQATMDTPPEADMATTTWMGITGLVVDLAIGGGALILTVTRLSLPYRTLPRGTRVA